MDMPSNEKLRLELYEARAHRKTVLRFIVFVVIVAATSLATQNDLVMNYIMNMPGPIVLLIIPAVIAVLVMILFWAIKPLDDYADFLDDLYDDLDLFS